MAGLREYDLTAACNEKHSIKMTPLKRIKWIIRSIPRWVGPSCNRPYSQPKKAYNILAIGICLAYKTNCHEHIKKTLASSRYHRVTQKWILINPGCNCDEKIAQEDGVYEKTLSQTQPRTLLLNQLLQDEDLSRFDAIIVVDDDIVLPPYFIDAYVEANDMLGFALSQPARTPNSYVSHDITRKVAGLLGRQTNFVEIGPLAFISRQLFSSLLPFDGETEIPMGLGLDLVWPVFVEEKGLTMGIIDAVPVDHSLRPPGSGYAMDSAITEMSRYLSTHRHIRGAQVIRSIRRGRDR